MELLLEIEVLYPNMDLSEWDQFVEISPQGSVFCLSWWLRSVCDDQFKIYIARQNSEIIGGFVLPIQQRYFLKYSMMPRYTQTLGPLFKTFDYIKSKNKITTEVNILEEIIAHFPNLQYFSHNCSSNFTNWLPFYWAGFNQTTRYSYILKNLNQLDEIHNNISKGYRNAIRRSTNNGIRVILSDDINEFLRINALTYSRKGLKLPYSKNFINTLISSSFQNESGSLFFAVDSKGNTHAAIFLVHNQRHTINLMQGFDSVFSSSGANTLLLWNAIQFASSKSKEFDFEGSMIRGIEIVYRRFGAELKPYFNISKVNGFHQFRKISSKLHLSKLFRK
jgi:hypothetical protein